MGDTNPSVHGVMIKNGDTQKPIWITEYGAPSSGPEGVGDAAQALELTQAITDTKGTSWIGALFIYCWEDTGTDPTTNFDWFGLLTANDSEKPAYTQVARALGKSPTK